MHVLAAERTGDLWTSANGDRVYAPDWNSPIYISTNPVNCSAFLPAYEYREGCEGLLGFPVEAFLRLVVVHGREVRLLNTTTSLVGYVAITNEAQALEFVRLFSERSTHYLFDDSEYIELSRVNTNGAVVFDVARAKAAGVPVDDLSPHVTRLGNGFTVCRYVASREGPPAIFDHSIFRLTESVANNGAYRIVEKHLAATNIMVQLPMYH